MCQSGMGVVEIGQNGKPVQQDGLDLQCIFGEQNSTFHSFGLKHLAQVFLLVRIVEESTHWRPLAFASARADVGMRSTEYEYGCAANPFSTIFRLFCSRIVHVSCPHCRT